MNTAVRLTLLVTFLCLGLNGSASKEEEIVETWAAKLGDELWQLGRSVTKVSEIKASYKKLNARVLPTDGEGILKTIVSNVNKLLKRKMDSVMCVIQAAEELAENFVDDNSTLVYFSSKFSANLGDLKPKERINYNSMELGADYHFYNIEVNTSFSSVHVPTDVLDKGKSVRGGLIWSEGLDEVFRRNYEADPTMSWQYFGSSSGFLRHYPALSWGIKDKVDQFDCRTRFWYIEAATCSKEVVILVDNSGSMWGMGNTIAKMTVQTILDTFSNNDFFNIFSFNKSINNIVPCFPPDLLVQATPENIAVFKAALKTLSPDEKADFPGILKFALELLEKSRANETCPEGICNQAVMLITDSLPENITKVFETLNWFDNRTRIPVRVFTYLIGKEVINVKEIQYMACMNRGYMVHIKSLEQVRTEVLKYISVIARPLVLQAIDHPLSWTHSFKDATGQYEPDDDSSYRFMTSVSGPAFDTAANRDNGTRKADLLGVAGTDVLISDIESLTLPYKIGANGYAFLITNNGYLLFHPDLRPVLKGVLKDNYNSVDLTEVELLDDNNEEPRDPSADILQLRKAMVMGEEGNMTGLKIKFHYDDMRRVGVEIRNYYFAPLVNTPFTMALVLPDNYGDNWIKAGDEIYKSKQMGIPISTYFQGNWRIHPDWVYCDYHWSSGKIFDSPEEKLLHFIEKMSSEKWEWKERFPDDDDDEAIPYNCNRPPVDREDYFCDKELIQLLVFDAKITEGSYKSSKWKAKDRVEEELVTRFNATLRFVATQSGLTRWQYIPEDLSDEESFGDVHNRALEEVWYRSAVLHHHLDPEAFVFSVPFNAGKLHSIPVTASHAIFPRDGGQEAPGSVVGFQLDHAALYKRFIKMTKPTCDDCTTSCESEELDCYVIDGNGYIVLSEIRNDTGQFFGDVEGAVMEAMIKKNIFRHVLMFDYQALCIENQKSKNSAGFLWTPFRAVLHLFQWIIGHILLTLLEGGLYVKAEIDETYEAFKKWEAQRNRPDFRLYAEKKKGDKDPDKPIEYVIVKHPIEKIEIKSCDLMGNLYLLQHLDKEGYHSEKPINCSRPFYVKRIPHTNLLLIVVNALHQSCYRPVSARMKQVEYNVTSQASSCQKLNLNSLPRRRLAGCYNSHPLEQEIVECTNKVNTNTVSKTVILTFLLISLQYIG